MNNLLIQTILAVRNSDGEDTIWMQILVLVILVVFFGIFSFARAKANKFKENNHNYAQNTPTQASQRLQHRQIPSAPDEESTHQKLSFSTPTTVANFNAPGPAKQAKSKKEKDLRSGMDLLELSFLLKNVENINGNDKEDVIIRRLNFKELLRRGKLNEADSKALKIYAINKDNAYGKDIQCEAMKSLAERTAEGNKRNVRMLDSDES